MELFTGDEIVVVGAVVSGGSTVNALEAGEASTLAPASVAVRRPYRARRWVTPSCRTSRSTVPPGEKMDAASHWSEPTQDEPSHQSPDIVTDETPTEATRVIGGLPGDPHRARRHGLPRRGGGDVVSGGTVSETPATV